MSDQQVALNESSQPLTTPLSASPLHVKGARLISNVFSPAVISLPFVVLVALYKAHNQLSNLLYALLALVFLSLGPFIYIVIGVRIGKFTDVDVSHRAQRIGPFLFGIATNLLGLLVLTRLNAPRNLQTLLVATACSGVLMMLITCWWKISIHTSSLAAVATMLTGLYGSVLLPSFLLVVIVGWSRVVLRRHTLAQVIGGTIMGVLLTTIVLTWRGI